MLTNLLVDVIGVNNGTGGASVKYECGGCQVQVTTKVKIVKENRNGGGEDNILLLYLFANGFIGCKVGF